MGIRALDAITRSLEEVAHLDEFLDGGFGQEEAYEQGILDEGVGMDDWALGYASSRKMYSPKDLDQELERAKYAFLQDIDTRLRKR